MARPYFMSDNAPAGFKARIAARLGRESNNFLGICVAVLATILLVGVSSVGKHVTAEVHPFVAECGRRNLLLG